MAQNKFFNITIDANAATKADRQDHRHVGSQGAAAAGDFTLSYDSAKATSQTILRSLIDEAMRQVAGSGLKA